MKEDSGLDRRIKRRIIQGHEYGQSLDLTKDRLANATLHVSDTGIEVAKRRQTERKGRDTNADVIKNAIQQNVFLGTRVANEIIASLNRDDDPSSHK